MGTTRQGAGPRRPATLRDIAAASGVSIPTVSKVLNGGGNVSPQTRQRILDAVEKLDFRPNGLAKAFALGKSYTVGILAQNAASTMASKVITGIVSELSKQDIAVLIYDDESDPRGNYDTEARLRNLRTLQARRADGVVIVSDGYDRPVSSVSETFDVPVIYAYASSTNANDACFVPDDKDAGYQGATHLINLGRKKIAHITGRRDSLAVAHRLAGVKRGLRRKKLCLALGEPLYGDWSPGWGAAAAERILERPRDVDAVVCGNDYIALGLAQTLEAHGVRVPDDIALVGYDNWSEYNGTVHDRFLTSVDPHLIRLGKTAAQALLNPEPPTPGIHYEPCELVLGASSGALPLGAQRFPLRL